MKKSIIIANIVIVLALIGGGMFWYVKKGEEVVNTLVVGDATEQIINSITGENNNKPEETIKEDPTPTEIIEEIQEIDTSNWKICKNEKLGIQFKYPDSWKNCYTNKESLTNIFEEHALNYYFSIDDNNNFIFQTKYNSYNIYLIAQIQKNNENDIHFYVNKRNGENYTNIKDGEAFKVVGFGGSFDYTGAILENNLYMISWNIESDEQAPQNVNGIWTPNHNINRNQIWNILKTIELIK